MISGNIAELVTVLVKMSAIMVGRIYKIVKSYRLKSPANSKKIKILGLFFLNFTVSSFHITNICNHEINENMV